MQWGCSRQYSHGSTRGIDPNFTPTHIISLLAVKYVYQVSSINGNSHYAQFVRGGIVL